MEKKKNHQKLQSSRFYSKKYMPAAYKKSSLPKAKIIFEDCAIPFWKSWPPRNKKVSSLSHSKLLDDYKIILLHHNW